MLPYAKHHTFLGPPCTRRGCAPLHAERAAYPDASLALRTHCLPERAPLHGESAACLDAYLCLQGILYEMLGGKEAHVTYEVCGCAPRRMLSVCVFAPVCVHACMRAGVCV